MQETTNKLAAWMSEQSIDKRMLATELGISYDLVYRLVTGGRTPTTNVQIRFINRYGRDEAAKVFDDSSVLALLETA